MCENSEAKGVIGLKPAFDILKDIEVPRSMQMYYDILYDFSVAIFDARQKSGLTKREFAKKLEVSEYKLAKLESGDYNFTLEDFCKVCDKLGLDIKVGFIRADMWQVEVAP